MGHAATVVLGGDVPVVEMPVVVGDDFEQVRDTPKFGDRVAELVGGQGVELFPRAVVSAYEARLSGGGLQVALGTERAIVPSASWSMGVQSVRGAASGRFPRPGTVHTSVPVSRFCCLTVPSASRTMARSARVSFDAMS